MAKKPRKEKEPEEKPKNMDLKEVPKKAYHFNKISLSEWQIIEYTIMGDMVVDEVRREPDIPVIVFDKLKREIREF